MALSQCPPLSDEQITKGRFSDCTVIVTGGASGIGKAAVTRFASDGARVIIFDVNSEQGEQLASSLKADGKQVEFMLVDVSDKEQCVVAVDKVASTSGRVNFLVNNAVSFCMKGLTATAEDWNKVMSVNVQGYANMVQACHPHMLKALLGYRAVVNMASISGRRAQPSNRWTYHASKGAILTMTKCMALDLANDGIRVNSVSPSWTYTAEVARVLNNDREKWEPIYGKQLMLNRFCEPSEVAAAIAYLCSRDASFITAADIPVDGGARQLTAAGSENIPT